MEIHKAMTQYFQALCNLKIAEDNLYILLKKYVKESTNPERAIRGLREQPLYLVSGEIPVHIIDKVEAAIQKEITR